jgi:hypothetical protein
MFIPYLLRIHSQTTEELNWALSEKVSQLENLRPEFEKCFAEKEEIRNEKMVLENECSDLKEKLEHLVTTSLNFFAALFKLK